MLKLSRGGCAKTHRDRRVSSLPLGRDSVKSNEWDTHVEPKAEGLRTRVQFPPPPPNTRPSMCYGHNKASLIAGFFVDAASPQQSGGYLACRPCTGRSRHPCNNSGFFMIVSTSAFRWLWIKPLITNLPSFVSRRRMSPAGFSLRQTGYRCHRHLNPTALPDDRTLMRGRRSQKPKIRPQTAIWLGCCVWLGRVAALHGLMPSCRRLWQPLN